MITEKVIIIAVFAALALAVGAYIRFVRAPALDPAQAVPAYAAVSSTLTLHANDPFEILARPASPPSGSAPGSWAAASPSSASGVSGAARAGSSDVGAAPIGDAAGASASP